MIVATVARAGIELIFITNSKKVNHPILGILIILLHFLSTTLSPEKTG